jgi:hypothetical protein
MLFEPATTIRCCLEQPARAIIASRMRSVDTEWERVMIGHHLRRIRSGAENGVARRTGRGCSDSVMADARVGRCYDCDDSRCTASALEPWCLSLDAPPATEPIAWRRAIVARASTIASKNNEVRVHRAAWPATFPVAQANALSAGFRQVTEVFLSCCSWGLLPGLCRMSPPAGRASTSARSQRQRLRGGHCI